MCPYKKKEMETLDIERHKGRRPGEDRGRDWSYAATGEGNPGASGGWKRQGRSLPQSLLTW